MKENNRLKKIIDLYVDKGANNDYLHEEMLKTFNSVSKEEKEEGYQYLNWKLQEAYNGSIRHYCEASDCLNEGTYSITRSDGKKEYYCYKHYKQMEEWAEMVMGY